MQSSTCHLRFGFPPRMATSILRRAMTTTLQSDVVCGVCGELSPQIHIASSNAFGSPDLDLRPPEMERSTIAHGVHHCPSCGCCARDLSKSSPSARRLIESDDYRTRLRESRFPALANMFACYAMILEAEGDYSEAAWAQINAAWVCDDANQTDAATECRNEGIRLAFLVMPSANEKWRKTGGLKRDLLGLNFLRVDFLPSLFCGFGYWFLLIWEPMKPPRSSHRCLNCKELFLPDYRCGARQRFCLKPECRQARKRESQRTWLAKPENRDYFRDAGNAQRVRKWQQAHPGYWKNTTRYRRRTLQDGCSEQPAVAQEVTSTSACRTLQHLCSMQVPLWVELISMFLGSTLPDDIATSMPGRWRSIGTETLARHWLGRLVRRCDHLFLSEPTCGSVRHVRVKVPTSSGSRRTASV